MSLAGQILIAGVGNVLLSDDGIGVHAIRKLQEQPIPGVVMADIGTAILHGLHFLESAERVLVIDAAKGGQPPGTIYLFDKGGQPPGTIYLFDSAQRTELKAPASIHALGLREAAGFLMSGGTPPKFTVLGVEPGSMDYGMNLSVSVQAALPRVIALARQTVAGWREAELAQAKTVRIEA
ncbi:MAG: hydrogenase maturation protease [Verrucomicrobia bacterium]|nr:hydrogenase maturation protease [Verrucomicrobiota bacterium]